jgi:hypothetical protein
MTKTENDLPFGYAVTLDCMNQPRKWDVPGMIADMAENLRRENDVPAGQLLAALDWMTFRLREARPILVAADSELSAVAHGRPVDKEESKRISQEARSLCEKLKGYSCETGSKTTTSGN